MEYLRAGAVQPITHCGERPDSRAAEQGLADMVHFRAAIYTAQSPGTVHDSGSAEPYSPCAAQVGWKFVIPDIAFAECRVTGAPPLVQAMDTGSSQG